MVSLEVIRVTLTSCNFHSTMGSCSISQVIPSIRGKCGKWITLKLSISKRPWMSTSSGSVSCISGLEDSMDLSMVSCISGLDWLSKGSCNLWVVSSSKKQSADLELRRVVSSKNG